MNEQEALPPDERELFDPYEGSRHMPWMDRSLSPSVRAARMMRPELKSFAVIEGREPNGADLDEMSGRISGEMVEILRREWAADVVNEWLEERDAAREGRPVDPSIGPKAQPIGGDPRDTSHRVFVAEPEDIDWVMARLGRRGSFGRRQVRQRLPGAGPLPPIALPQPTPQQPPAGSLMTPADPETPASPPPFPAAEPLPPIPPMPAHKLAPLFEELIPLDLKEIFRPIPGSEAIAKGGEPLILPGPLIGNPGLQIPVHILSVLWGGKQNEVRMISGLVDPDELIKRHEHYGILEELARQAGDIVGPGNGAQHGRRVHGELEKLIKQGVRDGILPKGMWAEVSYVPDGSKAHYGEKGSIRIDIIHDLGRGTVHAYELKTGGAALKEPRIDRTLAYKYFKDKKTVIVMELNPWRLPRK